MTEWATIVLGNVGLVYEERGDLLEAVALHQQSLHICQEIGYRSGEGTALHNEACIYLKQGCFQKAVDLFLLILPLRREVEDASGEGFTLHQISVAYSQQGKYKEALTYALESIRLRRRIGDRFNEVHPLMTLGHIHWCQHEHKEALQCYYQALDICEEVKNHPDEATVLYLILRLFQETRQYLFALAAFFCVQDYITSLPKVYLSQLNNCVDELIDAFEGVQNIVFAQVKPFARQIVDQSLNISQEFYARKKNISCSTIYLDIRIDNEKF